ncbi:MAG: hypothetical protein KJ015_20680 [Myxococcales bacterium]|nr:hypothetical protein [Sorangiineae bacterium PRO1]MCL4752591.1 hypothetical protein [Myxococcales bacterium]
MDPELMNLALDLALAWGPDFLQPTQGRLALLRPELSQHELDRYDDIARDAMNTGHSIVQNLALERGLNDPSVPAEAKALVAEQLPWVSSENLARIVSQGMYFAWKDGA